MGSAVAETAPQTRAACHRVLCSGSGSREPSCRRGYSLFDCTRILRRSLSSSMFSVACYVRFRCQNIATTIAEGKKACFYPQLAGPTQVVKDVIRIRPATGHVQVATSNANGQPLRATPLTNSYFTRFALPSEVCDVARRAQLRERPRFHFQVCFWRFVVEWTCACCRQYSTVLYGAREWIEWMS